MCHIMTDRGWQRVGGEIKTKVEAPKRWWNYAHMDEGAYNRQFMTPANGVEIDMRLDPRWGIERGWTY